ncbi:chloroplast sensor kinase [Arabidopsis thaliana]|uniref:Chloroplast sensor kinase, chloroplastic n=1 Tax=Arabidopsis thaliana TaxID=3702 RepID=CSK_ARATH|nr:chloroplast sensor kinase [Arabidopsis thaliana]F4HVG8.1 RecName: Full=Chloroplast sensor kinase, chloroplastic; Flags: Precursor [Arabidopsis thaliana]AEE34705.1 chloroplast sensor kinase [Arabidopsis thaliana]|eukprot:NP_564908.1 chloroplast sensor kinase [Arabidopsis thaliana]
MLLSAIASQTLLSSNPNLHFSNSIPNPRPSNPSLKLLNASSSSSSSSSSSIFTRGLRYVNHTVSNEESEPGGGETMVASASAIASAIRGASTTPVEFTQMIEKDHLKTKIILPSPDFQRLCLEQLDLFRQIVDPNAVLSIYVRPAGSYVMDRLELRRVTCYPSVNAGDVVILVGNFGIPAGLRAAEASLSSQQVELVSKHRAAVFPMVKHPFVVGFLVAELPVEAEEEEEEEEEEKPHGVNQFLSPEEAYALPASANTKSPRVKLPSVKVFTEEQRSYAINISRTLAMAYVMDQKTMLLQQSSWQNNVRMSKLVEQIRGPLSTMRTLSKMLSTHTKRNQISHDIVEDLIVQGDQIKDTLEELQDAVHLTKANIVRHNEEALKKINKTHNETRRSKYEHKDPIDGSQISSTRLSLGSGLDDSEMPMPPLALAPLQMHSIRPCDISNVLLDMVETVRPLALTQQRVVELGENSASLQVAVEEPALRQALSNLIEGALLRTHVGGKVEILSTRAPAGGSLVVIDDDGPDMRYMTQMHSLTPFGAELLSENMVEDNMTWNFVAGLTVAREILESYGCVIRVISPRSSDAALGAGGTRVELWLPAFPAAVSEANEA